jgi:hypothetical protein
MKRKILLPLTAIAICGLSFMYLSKLIEQKDQKIKDAETEVLRLWDEKIAEYQYLVNVNYRDSEFMKSFFDSLIISYDKLRVISSPKDLVEADKKYLRSFIFKQMAAKGFINKAEILPKLKVKSAAQMFEGTKLEQLQRLESILSPYFMTKCMYFQDYDIWEKTNNRILQPGDTTVFMIRILKNYDLRSHQLELIPSRRMKIVKPYLGELEVAIPKSENDLIKINFQMYNWLERDTVTQNIYLSREWVL